jgi:MFS family permease
VSTLLFAFLFTLYFVFSLYLPRHIVSSPDARLLVQASVNFAIAGTLLLMVFFINRISTLRLIYASSVATAITAAILFLTSNEALRIVTLITMGIFFGMGLLAFFTLFYRSTIAEERGRTAGLIGFFSLPFCFILLPLVAETLDFPSTIMLSILLSLGVLIAGRLMPEEASLATKEIKRGNYSEKRIVFLYSIPWVIFSLINVTLAKSISFSISQQVSLSLYLVLIISQLLGVLLGAVIGGIVADFFGRRLALVFSLTLYGASSALIGIFQNSETFALAYLGNGLSWGILLTLYFFVIWGDFSNTANCSKMYSIGLVIYYVTMGFGVIPLQTSQLPLVISALTSCLLVFLSNIPVVLAPELLSSDFRERIKLRLHMNAARKIAEKSRSQG